MKKIMMLLVLMVVVLQNISAKSVKQLINEFKHEDKAESVYVSPLLMKVAKIAADKDDMDEAGRLALKKVKSIRILSLEDCNKSVKDRFSQEVENLNDEEYQPLIVANSDGDKVKVMMLTKNDIIRELVIFTVDDEDSAIIQINGKLTQDDIQFIVNDQTTKSKSKSKKG